MISFINNALKHRNGEKGFSLVELIVVVAILGILVVIAIPVFGAIQTTARQNTVATAAANAATSIAARIASDGPSGAQVALDALNLAGGGVTTYAGPYLGDSFNSFFAAPATPPQGGWPYAATNDSVDTVYVYAKNERGEWAGAGSAAGSTNSWD